MFADLPPLLTESDLVPVGCGSERDVFGLAGHPDLLVKLHRHGGPREARVLRREVRTARLCAERSDLPVARVFGAWPAERGTAILVEALRSADGTLARTLRALREGPEGLPPDLAALMTEMVGALRACGLHVRDFTIDNIVLADGGRDGRRRLLLVDGYGDHKPFPVYEAVRWLRERDLARRFRARAAQLGLRWDPATWTMHDRGPADRPDVA